MNIVRAASPVFIDHFCEVSPQRETVLLPLTDRRGWLKVCETVLAPPDLPFHVS